MEHMTCRLWLWSAPLPEDVADDFRKRSIPILDGEASTVSLLEAATEFPEQLLVDEPQRIAELIATALGLPPQGPAALRLDPGRCASLVLGPRGWELERFGSFGTGPHLAAPR